MKVIGLHIENHTLRRKKRLPKFQKPLFILKTRGYFKVSIFFPVSSRIKKKEEMRQVQFSTTKESPQNHS